MDALTTDRSRIDVHCSGAFTPIDEVVADSLADRLSLADIEHRLARVTAAAAQPNATPLGHQLVANWTAIRHAKLTGDGVA